MCFCGRRPLSEEHVWPEWCHQYVRKPNIAKAFIQKRWLGSHLHQGGRREIFHKETPTDVTEMTLKIVCRDHCNSGWISQLEEKTKPFLLPLLNGTHAVLERYRQEMIATWIAMKLMTCEFSDPEDVMFSDVDRSIFMGSRKPPQCMKMWIGLYEYDGWNNTYTRQAATLGWAPIGTVPKQPPGGSFAKNTQEQTFVIGRLFVHSTATTVPLINTDVPPILRGVLRQIWPYQSNFLWPVGPSLTDQQVSFIVGSFERFTSAFRFAPGPAQR